jgi:hypothetical protein
LDLLEKFQDMLPESYKENNVQFLEKSAKSNMLPTTNTFEKKKPHLSSLVDAQFSFRGDWNFIHLTSLVTIVAT